MGSAFLDFAFSFIFLYQWLKYVFDLLDLPCKLYITYIPLALCTRAENFLDKKITIQIQNEKNKIDFVLFLNRICFY